MNRWRVSRMGFVNFWLYDQETFLFANGKLLLRGPNASGKSITTQSFIPFILDGNKSPDRLDPFGSKDRKMDYYLLGDNDKEDSTGYLFMEFKREKSDQYITIGIGLRAQKGKPMSFWGFALTDGRRIGYDIQLYREVGDQNIPLLKQELKNVIGDKGRFTDSIGEYMDMVNQLVFKFARLDEYDQFIRLLIKVRAPKLSRDMKPSLIYSVLNDSLQTLSDEDLRAMIDAMEKLDDMALRLDGLKSAQNDARIIKNEYERYNRYMLGKKAEKYYVSYQEVETQKGKQEAKSELLSEGKIQLEKEINHFEQSKIKKEQLEKKKDALGSSNIEDTVTQLQNVEKELAGKVEEQNKKESYLAEQSQKLKDTLRGIDDINKRKEEVEYEFESYIDEFEEFNEELQFANHKYYVDKLKNRKTEDIGVGFQRDMKALEKQISMGRQALINKENAEREWDEEVKRTGKIRSEFESGRIQWKDAKELETEARDKLVENYYLSNKNNMEMKFSLEQLTHITTIISRFSGSLEDKELNDIQSKQLSELSNNLKDKIYQQKKICEETEEKLIKCKMDLENLQNTPELVPQREEKVIRARNELARKDIPFYAFYETVDFSSELKQEEKDLIEEQLYDMGILDALVIPEEYQRMAEDILKEYADCFCLPDVVPAGNHMKDLVFDCKDERFRIIVNKVLQSISGADINARSAIFKDGRFQTGILCGHSIVTKPAGFVGAAARREYKERMLQALRLQLKDFQEVYEVQKNILENLEIRETALSKEYSELPKTMDLMQAITLVEQTKKVCDDLQNKLVEQEYKENNAKQRLQQFSQLVLEHCKGLPYKHSVEEFEEAEDNRQKYMECFQTLEKSTNTFLILNNNLNSKQELADGIQEHIDRYYVDVRKLKHEIGNLESRIIGYKEFLSRPENKELAEKLKTLKEEINVLNKEIIEYSGKIEGRKKENERYEQELQEMDKKFRDALDKETFAAKYFKEELELGLLQDISGDTTIARAISAKTVIRDQDKSRPASDLTAALITNFKQHSSSLTQFAPKADIIFDEPVGEDFLRSRQYITLTWQGKTLSLYDFMKELNQAIADSELLIEAEDRKLFESILSNTISKKLYNRIGDCKKWVEDMDSLMRSIDTSMDLRFGLEWKGRKRDEEVSLDTSELVKLLNRDRQLLTQEDIESVSDYFRSQIKLKKTYAEENGEIVNYADLIREALDYRNWFEFKLSFWRGDGKKNELTNSEFNKFSGGEKAMAMYVPLFAAVSAQYKKASQDCPLLIALDEAFAGVDEKNISSMFKLAEDLNFCYIMNSQALWGCYETVPELEIAELVRPLNSQVISVINYTWNGREKVYHE